MADPNTQDGKPSAGVPIALSADAVAGQQTLAWMLSLNRPNVSEADHNDLLAVTTELAKSLALQKPNAVLPASDFNDPKKLQQRLNDMDALVSTPADKLTADQRATLELVGTASQNANFTPPKMVLDDDGNWVVNGQQYLNKAVSTVKNAPVAASNLLDKAGKEWDYIDGKIKNFAGSGLAPWLEGGVGAAVLLGATSGMDSGLMKTGILVAGGLLMIDMLMHHSDNSSDVTSSLFGSHNSIASSDMRQRTMKQFDNAATGAAPQAATPGPNPASPAPQDPARMQDEEARILRQNADNPIFLAAQASASAPAPAPASSPAP